VATGSANGALDIRKLKDDVWLINGTVSLDEVNRRLDVSLEADNADRIAGWITFHAGRLPQVGQTVEAQGCRATVRRLRKRRIDALQLEVLDRPDEDTDVLPDGDDLVYESTAEELQ
jgi:CBS domain containing-hemolysin-like protein